MWTTEYPNSRNRLIRFSNTDTSNGFKIEIDLLVEDICPYLLEDTIFRSTAGEDYVYPEFEEGRDVLVVEMKIMQRLIRKDNVEFHLVPRYCGETNYSFKKCVLLVEKDQVRKEEDGNNDISYFVELSFKNKNPIKTQDENPEKDIEEEEVDKKPNPFVRFVQKLKF